MPRQTRLWVHHVRRTARTCRWRDTRSNARWRARGALAQDREGEPRDRGARRNRVASRQTRTTGYFSGFRKRVGARRGKITWDEN